MSALGRVVFASRRTLRAVVLAGALLSSGVSAQMNSATITAATINPFMLPCFNHCVIGICFWLRITLTGPRIETDRKSTRLNSSHLDLSRMPSSA